MYDLLRHALKKLQRDQHLSWQRQLGKAGRFGLDMVLAPIYLRGVTQVGAGVRAWGKPRIENFGTMYIGTKTLIRSVNVPVELCTGDGATLRIGRHCSINYGVSVGATGSITIGDRVRIGPYTMIVDTDFHDVHRRDVRPPPRPVVIEDDVWIGAKACIMPGVRIGRGSIVGTAAVVTKDVAPFTIVGGIPAKPLRTLDAKMFVPEVM
jgi:acetyltransferase-like isoleucine patch superfamily enzyme